MNIDFPSASMINQAHSDYTEGRRTWYPTWASFEGRTGIAPKYRVIWAESTNKGDLLLTLANGIRIHVRDNDFVEL